VPLSLASISAMQSQFHKPSAKAVCASVRKKLLIKRLLFLKQSKTLGICRRRSRRLRFSQNLLVN